MPNQIFQKCRDSPKFPFVSQGDRPRLKNISLKPYNSISNNIMVKKIIQWCRGKKQLKALIVYGNNMFLTKDPKDSPRANVAWPQDSVKTYIILKRIMAFWGHIMREDVQITLYTTFSDIRVINKPKKLKKWFRQH